MRAKDFIPAEKPRNFVAKNAKMGGAGQHKDKKKAEKQGDLKHKNKQFEGDVAGEGVFSFLKAEPVPKKKWDPAKDSRASSNYKNNDDSWVKLLIDKHRRGIELTDREWNSIEQWKLKRAMRGESSEIQELSNEKLGAYKKAAGADAKKADSEGNYKRGDKRFSGIIKATKKQFDNDTKGVAEASLKDYVEAGVCPICLGDMISEDQLEEGKKDACYHKIKASSKVWPSAYASGRLVQCRKKGAANYGKGKKK